MKLIRFRVPALVTCGIMAAPASAYASYHTPSVTGHREVAVMLLLGFVAIIYFVIMGALSLDRRDARAGRGNSRRDDGWFGIFPHTPPDDDESPDFHHHGGDGGEGGEGGEAG